MLALLFVAGLFLSARAWLSAHPQHDPRAPLDLRQPDGWTTAAKFARIKEDVAECRAVLERSDVAHAVLPPAGEPPCLQADRVQLAQASLAPTSPPVTCPVAAAMTRWRTATVEPAAEALLGSALARIEHVGAFSCRRLYGREDGAFSEHATGNAIDIAAFVLSDGRRISVLQDWYGDDEEARFLRAVRDGACRVFATVLSPDYNAAHADHFHFDQSGRWRRVCR